MNNMELLHNRMSRHVVTIKVKIERDDEADEIESDDEADDGRDYEAYDGIVLSSQQNCLYIIASSKFRDKIDTNLIQVELPNSTPITIKRDDFDMAAQDSGILGIRCTNPRPGVECGFGELDPIDICEDVVNELQAVYTYSHHSKERLLTPGSIMLVEEDSFDHDCVRFTGTHKGAPTVNRHGHLVGFCFSHKGYLTSYNIREVAARIERNQRRQFTRTSDTFQHLRQQCRAIEFSLRQQDGGRVVYVRIQRIGQLVAAASWENLEEFRQQHPAFQVDEEIEQGIQQALARMTGRYYVRDKERRVFF